MKTGHGKKFRSENTLRGEAGENSLMRMVIISILFLCIMKLIKSRCWD